MECEITFDWHIEWNGKTRKRTDNLTEVATVAASAAEAVVCSTSATAGDLFIYSFFLSSWLTSHSAKLCSNNDHQCYATASKVIIRKSFNYYYCYYPFIAALLTISAPRLYRRRVFNNRESQFGVWMIPSISCPLFGVFRVFWFSWWTSFVSTQTTDVWCEYGSAACQGFFVEETQRGSGRGREKKVREEILSMRMTSGWNSSMWIYLFSNDLIRKHLSCVHLFVRRIEKA